MYCYCCSQSISSKEIHMYVAIGRPEIVFCKLIKSYVVISANVNCISDYLIYSETSK